MKKNKICFACNKEFKNVKRCPHTHLVDDNHNVARRVAGKNACDECGAENGGLHHLGCKNELCPMCKKPLNSAKCTHIWESSFKTEKKHKALKKHVFQISTGRFALLGILTFGLFPFYWMFKTWVFFIKKEDSDLSPLVLTLLWPIYLFVLAQKIRTFAEEQGVDGASKIAVPIFAILMYFSWIFDISYLWLLPFSFIAFLNLHNAMDQIAKRINAE